MQSTVEQVEQVWFVAWQGRGIKRRCRKPDFHFQRIEVLPYHPPSNIELERLGLVAQEQAEKYLKEIHSLTLVLSPGDITKYEGGVDIESISLGSPREIRLKLK